MVHGCYGVLIGFVFVWFNFLLWLAMMDDGQWG